jgi:hypothetical protein
MAHSLTRLWQLGVLPLLVVVISCSRGGGTGYINVHLISFTPQFPIYLASMTISEPGDRIIEHKVGTVSVTNGRHWLAKKMYCQLRIRANRITTVTVRLVDGKPHCQCEIPARESTPDKVVCW